MPAHRIHLRGPWEYEWLPPPTETAGSSALLRDRAGSVRVPVRWGDLFGDLEGRTRFRRKFHRPTNLDADERLFLIFEGVAGEATVKLDERSLGRIPLGRRDAEFDVTELVRPNSELVVELDFDPARVDSASEFLWDAVALEIRRPAPANESDAARE